MTILFSEKEKNKRLLTETVRKKNILLRKAIKKTPKNSTKHIFFELFFAQLL